MTRIKKDEGEEYVNAFPKFKKWINECICCHEKGYKPNMPDKIGDGDFNLGSYNIKKYFKHLPLNEDGICPTCEKALKNIKK